MTVTLGESLNKLANDSAKCQLQELFIEQYGPMSTWNELTMRVYERLYNGLNKVI